MAQPTQYQRVGTTQHDVTEAGVASLGYLYFDGVNDAMATSTITPGTDKAQVFAGVRKLSDTAVRTVLELSGDKNSSAGVFALFAPDQNSPSYYWLSKGTLESGDRALGYPALTANVLTGIGDIGGDISALRVDGSQAFQSTANQGTGNYLAYPLYIGARAGTSLFFLGHLYSLITRFGPTLDAPTIASTETWVAGKTGISIP